MHSKKALLTWWAFKAIIQTALLLDSQPLSPGTGPVIKLFYEIQPGLNWERPNMKRN